MPLAAVWACARRRLLSGSGGAVRQSVTCAWLSGEPRERVGPEYYSSASVAIARRTAIVRQFLQVELPRCFSAVTVPVLQLVPGCCMAAAWLLTGCWAVQAGLAAACCLPQCSPVQDAACFPQPGSPPSHVLPERACPSKSHALLSAHGPGGDGHITWCESDTAAMAQNAARTRMRRRTAVVGSGPQYPLRTP